MQSIKEKILKKVVLILEKQPAEEELTVFISLLFKEKIEVIWYIAEKAHEAAESVCSEKESLGEKAEKRRKKDRNETEGESGDGKLEEILIELDTVAANEREKQEKRGILFLSDNPDICGLAVLGGCSCIACLTEENKDKEFTGVRYAVESLANIDGRFMERVCRRYAGLPWEILQTKRCVVREMTTADVPSFYEIYKEPSITAYMEGLFSEEEQETEYVKNYIKNVYEFFEYGLWTIVEKKSGKIIGRAGISWREETGETELGYVIAVPFQRQGYAYEVCSAILQYAKEELEIEQVAAYVKEENVASNRLCHKLGFQKEGNKFLRNICYEKWMKKIPDNA